MDATPVLPQSLPLQSDESPDWTDENLLTHRPPPREDSTPSGLAPSSAEPAETEEDKKRDSIPVVTSGEADDVDIDAMLAEENSSPLASGVIHVPPGSQPPADPDGPVAPETDDASGVIASQETARIADNEFDAARGRPASIHPESGESAGISHADLVRADIVTRLKKAHVTLAEPDKAPLSTLQHMATVILDGYWINDESALREVMLLTLAALDPKGYGDKQQNLAEGPTAALTHVFLLELGKNKVPNARKLEEHKPREGIALPPLPSSPSSPRPVPSPPRPGKKR